MSLPEPYDGIYGEVRVFVGLADGKDGHLLERFGSSRVRRPTSVDTSTSNLWERDDRTLFTSLRTVRMSDSVAIVSISKLIARVDWNSVGKQGFLIEHGIPAGGVRWPPA